MATVTQNITLYSVHLSSLLMSDQEATVLRLHVIDLCPNTLRNIKATRGFELVNATSSWSASVFYDRARQ